MFLLETFQAGLSWITILHLSPRGCSQFDVNKIAMYDDCKINELMNNPKSFVILEKLKRQLKMHKYLLKYRKNMVLFLNIYGHTMIKLFMKKENETTKYVIRSNF